MRRGTPGAERASDRSMSANLPQIKFTAQHAFQSVVVVVDQVSRLEISAAWSAKPWRKSVAARPLAMSCVSPCGWPPSRRICPSRSYWILLTMSLRGWRSRRWSTSGLGAAKRSSSTCCASLAPPTMTRCGRGRKVFYFALAVQLKSPLCLQHPKSPRVPWSTSTHKVR